MAKSDSIYRSMLPYKKLKRFKNSSDFWDKVHLYSLKPQPRNTPVVKVLYVYQLRSRRRIKTLASRFRLEIPN